MFDVWRAELLGEPIHACPQSSFVPRNHSGSSRLGVVWVLGAGNNLRRYLCVGAGSGRLLVADDLHFRRSSRQEPEIWKRLSLPLFGGSRWNLVADFLIC